VWRISVSKWLGSYLIGTDDHESCARFDLRLPVWPETRSKNSTTGFSENCFLVTHFKTPFSTQAEVLVKTDTGFWFIWVHSTRSDHFCPDILTFVQTGRKNAKGYPLRNLKNSHMFRHRYKTFFLHTAKIRGTCSGTKVVVSYAIGTGGHESGFF
jgi:hypothetical protein